MSTGGRSSDTLKSSPGALTRMGFALMGSGEGAKAVALLEPLLAADPDNPELHAAARAILSHRIPHWHGPMLADEARNAAFQAAIERAVRPGMTVLDIGTGSSLLALMAARAGADRIIACEAHPALAATARKVVALNGHAGRISVLAKSSLALDRETELHGGADLILAEVFADDLLNEGALATLDHARKLRGHNTELLSSGHRLCEAL